MSDFPARVQLTQFGRFRVVTRDVCAARINTEAMTVVTACGFSADIDGDIPTASTPKQAVTCKKCRDKGEQ